MATTTLTEGLNFDTFMYDNPMYMINHNELPPSSKPPISLNPQPSAGLGDVGSSLPVYAQPDLSKKRSHQQVLEPNTYSKLERETTTSPLLATSLEGDSAYSHAEFPTPSPLPTKQPQGSGVLSFSNPVYEIKPIELPPTSQPPISPSPQPSAGSGDAESVLPVYSQPDLSKKRSHQQVSTADPYSKLARITTTATSLEDDPAYSHLDLPMPLPSHITPSADLEYDDFSSTPRLELKEKEPASKVAYYDDVAADNPYPISNDIPSVNVHLVAYDEPREARTSFNGNPASRVTQHATPTPSPHSSEI